MLLVGDAFQGEETASGAIMVFRSLGANKTLKENEVGKWSRDPAKP